MTAPTNDSTVVVDPRFRTRRIEVRKAAGRHRLHRLLLLIVVAALALATVIVLKSPLLDVDRVDIAGARATDVDQLDEVAGIGLGSAILLADLEGAEDRIRALPWVEDVAVERELPGTVHVDIVERTPAAVVTGGGVSVLTDRDGSVMSSADPVAIPAAVETSPPFVAVVVADAPPGPGGRVDAGLLDAIALAERVRADPAGAVVAVHLDPALRLDLAGGGQVEFGDGTQLDAKLDAFRTIHSRVDQRCVGVVDLRVPERPVLTRDESCS